MFNPTSFLRYWYVWLLVGVFLIAAATGFRETMRIPFDEVTFTAPCWSVILALAVLLAAIALIYQYLDERQIAFSPRWLRPVHLSISLICCIAFFVYLEILLNRRLSNVKAVFDSHYKHYESLPDVYLLVPVLFVLAQIGFAFYLKRILQHSPPV